MRERGLKPSITEAAITPPLSLPVRERGLKPWSQIFCTGSSVAPRAGAWIEAPTLPALHSQSSVAPRAGAWIEAGTISTREPQPLVAPRAGAWIEALIAIRLHGLASVAPRAGAWIEAYSLQHPCAAQASLPVRERGLKPALCCALGNRISRSPCGSVD